MKRTKVFTGLACALLVAVQLGCGAFQGNTNNLQSITLNTALVNGAVPSSQGNFVPLSGLGGTIQFQVLGNYTNGKSVDISNKVAYTVVVANPPLDQSSYGVLLPPCQPPSCPAGSPGSYTNGTIQYDSTGLVTAVQPAACTYVEDSSDVEGAYVVTASYQGFTSQPAYIPVASAPEPDGSSCGGIGSFTLAASPSSLTVNPGSTGQSAISVTASGGFAGAVNLTATTPTGITATFNPSSIQAGGSSVLTLTVGSGVSPNSYVVNVTGASGTVTASTTVSLTVP